jgi:hypothetical protein
MTCCGETFRGAMAQHAYLRPFHPFQNKVLFDLAHGHYWLVFRGFHALLAVAAVLLFVRAMRVRTIRDVYAAAFALTVLTGMHTFRVIEEAFPVSHYLESVVVALLALNLAQAKPRLTIDIAAAVIFAAAVLNIESGLLMWVVAVAAWATGLRGISIRGIAMMTIVLAGYFYLRFGWLSMGVPGLEERSAGYLFARLDPAELKTLFADRLAWFYAYNVGTSILAVLFSEPQAGIFVAIHNWMTDGLQPRDVLGVGSSLLTTLAILWAMTRSVSQLRAPEDRTRLLLIFVVVLGANAVLSFAYTKDEIMSVAGVFYALAAYAAVGRLFEAEANWSRGAAIVLVALLIAAPAWALRSVGLHHILRSQAFKQRNDWAQVTSTWRSSGLWPEDPAEQQLILDLRNDALDMRVPNPGLQPRWADRVWGD